MSSDSSFIRTTLNDAIEKANPIERRVVERLIKRLEKYVDMRDILTQKSIPAVYSIRSSLPIWERRILKKWARRTLNIGEEVHIDALPKELAASIDCQSNNNGCWIWTDKVNNQGDPIIYINSKPYRTNRHIWNFLYGKAPSKVLRNKDYCPNKQLCVNPTHIIAN